MKNKKHIYSYSFWDGKYPILIGIILSIILFVLVFIYSYEYTGGKIALFLVAIGLFSFLYELYIRLLRSPEEIIIDSNKILFKYFRNKVIVYMIADLKKIKFGKHKFLTGQFSIEIITSNNNKIIVNKKLRNLSHFLNEISESNPSCELIKWNK